MRQFDTFAQKGPWSKIHMCYLNLLLYVCLIVLRWLCYLFLHFVLYALYFSIVGWSQGNRVQVTGIQSMIITLTYFVSTFKWSPKGSVSALLGLAQTQESCQNLDRVLLRALSFSPSWDHSTASLWILAPTRAGPGSRMWIPRPVLRYLSMCISGKLRYRTKVLLELILSMLACRTASRSKCFRIGVLCVS